MKSLLALVVVALIMVGCNNKPAGPSAAEIELSEMKAKEAKAQARTEAQAAVATATQQLSATESALAKTHGAIASAQDEANNAGSFHLLRSHDEREQEIAAANERIAQLKLQQQEEATAVDQARQNLANAQSKLASLQ